MQSASDNNAVRASARFARSGVHGAYGAHDESRGGKRVERCMAERRSCLAPRREPLNVIGHAAAAVPGDRLWGRLPEPGNHMRYRVLIEQDEDGVFVAEVPSLPGCVSQGGTREEALSNVREAIALYLESLEEHGDPVPPPITEEIIEV